MVVCLNLNAGQIEAVGLWGSLGEPTRPSWEASGSSDGQCLREQGEWCLSSDIHGWPVVSICIHTHKHIYLNISMHPSHKCSCVCIFSPFHSTCTQSTRSTILCYTITNNFLLECISLNPQRVLSLFRYCIQHDKVLETWLRWWRNEGRMATLKRWQIHIHKSRVRWAVHTQMKWHQLP